MLTRELIRKIDELAIECEDTYSMATMIEDIFEEIFNDFEQQMKAKDEEIERLNCRAYHAEGYISDLHNHPKDKKFYDAKARSIVAMLFWKAKRQKRVFQKYYEEYGLNHSLTQNYRGMYEQAIMDFIKSHKMLKDNK